MRIPKVLVIDDQYGRCGLGRAFRKAVSPEIFAAFMADRRNLCNNFGIFDLTGDSKGIERNKAQCDAIFTSGQRWSPESQCIENDLEIAMDAVERGWSFADGSRWALVLVDLAFVCGKLDPFGDPQERTMFGRDVILPALKSRFGEDLPVVVVSSTPKEENNAEIRRMGALDFIQRIPTSLGQSASVRSQLGEMLFLHGLVPDFSGTVVGESLSVLKMLRQARRASRYASTILLHGEIGCGKNLLARYIHEVSPRKAMPFEIFNAANRSAELQSDELFGHWKGAFTGAVANAPGLWERCNGGSVLIDEVADLDLSVQQKLMGPIEEKRVARVGSCGEQGERKVPVDVLTILATNRDLDQLSASGKIKKDFLSRISATKIKLPSLRDRRQDIPLLVGHLVSKLPHAITFLPDALGVMEKEDWRVDNIRGLRRTIEELSVNHPNQSVTATDVHRLMQRLEGGSVVRGELSSTNGLGVIGEFLSALERVPDQCSRERCRQLQESLAGSFPDVLAYMLMWSLQLCGDVTNAARFMTGNTELDTSAAKQFVKKIIKLDVRNQSVLNAFAKYREADIGMLREMIDEELRR